LFQTPSASIAAILESGTMTRYAFQMTVWSNDRDIRLWGVKALAAFFLLWGFSSLNGQQEPNGLLDFSCSTFPADLSASDLVARYGQENVATALVTGADDPPLEGTVLFPKLEDARVEIAWYDVQTKQNAMWIRIQGRRSQWRLPNGIALGDDLVGVERRNGFPFRLSSFSVEGQVSYGPGEGAASIIWMRNGAVPGSRSSQTGTERTIRS